MEASEDEAATSCGSQSMDASTFLTALGEIYARKPSLRAAWLVEEPPLAAIVPALVEEVAFNYTLLAPIDVGGSGIIAKVCDENLQALRALKFARPIPGSESELSGVLRRETEKLRDLVHPNLVRIFAQGACAVQGTDVPYYIMDFIEGGEDAEKFLRRNPREATLLAIVRGALSGLAYMHAHDTVHLDIKPGNVFLSSHDDVRVADLGFAKVLSDDNELTPGGGTLGYMHPDFLEWKIDSQSENRQQTEVPRNLITPVWDLYSLGRTIKRLIRILDEVRPRELSPYTRRYLRLMFCRLLDGRNDPDEQALGITVKTFGEIRYATATEALVDFEKLTGSYNLDARIPELAAFMEDSIQASPFGAVAFTPRVAALLDVTHLRQLGAFTQLGLLSLVYPTATHTRLEHALGTFAVVCQYLRALYHDPVNPLFKQIMSEQDLRAALLAALLHDIGHYPLAHDLEEGDSLSFSHEARTLKLLEKPSRLREICERQEESQVSAGDGASQSVEEEDEAPGWAVPVERVMGILSANPNPRKLRGSLKEGILHSIIDGPIDADKVDYLTRDSSRLHLSFGRGIDYDRLVRTLTIVVKAYDDRSSASLGIHEGGKIPAESVAFARYSMFGAVYWHHTYRSIKAMIDRIAWEALRVYCGGDVDKPRKNYRDKARSDLEEYLASHLVDWQQVGFERPSPMPVPSVAGAAECGLLEWLGGRAGPQGQFLARALLSRSLYRRALVVSESRAGSVLPWGDIRKLFRPTTSWTRKLKLSQIVQDNIRVALRNTNKPEVELTGVTPATREEFGVIAEKMPLVLVDYPPERPGSDVGLGYLREDDRLSRQSGEIQIGDVGESDVWLALRDQARPSLAKLRVYCHPRFVKTLVSYLPRSVLEECVRDAVALLRGAFDEED